MLQKIAVSRWKLKQIFFICIATIVCLATLGLGLGLGFGTGNRNDNPAEALPNENRVLPRGVAQVSAGGQHTMAIDSQGNLWAFGGGANNYGQLGNMSTSNSSTPINITAQSGNPLNGKQITQVSTGDFHTVAIDSQGNLWAWGDGANGRLGNMSTTRENSTPINITTQSGNPLNGKQIVQVSAGYDHTVAIDATGNLWVFGYNYNGQLGNMSITASSTPINITTQSGNPLYGKQIVQVSAGCTHTAAIDSQGNLWAFGNNGTGQLGNMSTTQSSTPINITTQSGNPLYGKQIVQVSAGNFYTIAIDSSGSLWAFGGGGSGRLGNMSNGYSNSTPINITAQSGNPLENKQIIQVSASGGSSYCHTIVIDAQANLWAFGYNYSGQLGNMSTTDSSTPINITAQAANPLNGKQIVQVSAGYNHTMAIDGQGNLWAFGSGSSGRLGNMSTSNSSTPINITAQPGNPLNNSKFGRMQVSASGLHTMVIDAAGNLWAFGLGTFGRLGNMSVENSSIPINITAQVGNPLCGKQIVQVATGYAHTMAIDATGNLWAFGYNFYGQLGNMTTSEYSANSIPINITTQPGNPLYGKQIVQVSTINTSTMAVDSQGNLWVFGENYTGQLGNMSTTSTSTPINITAQPGNPLYGKQIVQVTADYFNTIAIDSQGNLWAWGYNDYGQFGNMTTSGYNANHTPINITAQSGNPLNGRQIVQVSAVGYHTAAIDSQGNLWTFGYGSNGQLGNMSTVSTNSTPINITAQSGNPLNGKQIVQISAGGTHTMAIDAQGSLWAFGNNYTGQLGNMSTTSTSTPINITAQSGNPLYGKQIIQVNLGEYNTFIIDSSGKLWAFGDGSSGQLGNMSTGSSSTPINIEIPPLTSTSATITGNPSARIQVRTNFTSGWGETIANGGNASGWLTSVSASGIIAGSDTQTGRVRYEFSATGIDKVNKLTINSTDVAINNYPNLTLWNNTLYLRIITNGSILIVEMDRICTKELILEAVATRNVQHSFNFSDNSHLSSRMRVGSSAETTSLTYLFDNLTWNGNTATAAAPAMFTFTSQVAFAKIIISSASFMNDEIITDFTNRPITVAGLNATLFYSPGPTNTLIITLFGMEQNNLTWTIETYQQVQVQQILNPPAGVTSIANPALLTLNSSAGGDWASAALLSPGNPFGKTFQGWYTHPDYTKGILISTTEQLQQHITANGAAVVFLYARWS